MSAESRPPQDQRRRAWQQQALGIILIAVLAFCYVFARYHRALLR